MLNEISSLAYSLERKGLAVTSLDARLKPFKKGPAYILRLSPKGEVARVEFMQADRVAELRRISPQNEKSFPGFNLNHTVYVIDEEWFSKAATLWDLLVVEAQKLPLGGSSKDRKALDQNLRYPAEELCNLFSRGDEDLEASRALIERMKNLTVDTLLRQLGSAAIRSVLQGDLDREAALILLCGKLSRDKRTIDPAKATLILDIDDSARLGARVASVEAAQAWNRELLKSKLEAQREPITCSLSGRLDKPIGEKMPQPSLPGLGLTYLMSMNKATPCQTRYGMTSTAVFPIGEESGQRLSDALQFITGAERKHRTFALVPSANSKTTDLLVAYLENDPGSELPVVDLFADLSSDPQFQQATYEARTSSLFQALRGLKPLIGDCAVRIFALKKLDPGRSQALFNGRYALQDLEDSLLEWFEGMRNIPEFALHVPVTKGQKPVLQNAAQPSPIVVLRSFKTLWIRQGAASASVPGVDLAVIFRLMLERDNALARPMLSRYLGLISSLLIGAGALRGEPKRLTGKGRAETLIALPILGMLLLKLGRKKESYMESREFLLGQYLQLADRLHKLYCECVREGKIPPQLAGNSTISAALQSPERAFQTVSQRIRVYIAWADSAKGEKAGLAIWHRRKIGEVCAQLAATQLPQRIDDPGRAQLFLGYLGELKNKEQSE